MKAWLLAGLAVLSVNALALEKGAVSGKVSTLGLGLEYTVPLNPQVEVGGAVNYFNYDRSYTNDDVQYDANARLLTFGAVGYFYPWPDHGFNINAGLFYNGNKVTLDAKTKKVLKLKNGSYDLNMINNPHGEILFNKISPYLGIGWKSGTRDQSGWGFNANLGVMFHGKPDVSLDASCKKTFLDSTTAEVKQICSDLKKDIDSERQSVQEDVDKFKFYPVASVGFIYRF